ncbi:MAG: Hint domain-containing protein [Pseudomonadota bacterium]
MANPAPILDQNNLIAQYLFNDNNQGQHPIADRTFQDTATANDGVAQTGTNIGSANTLNATNELDLDGENDAVLIAADDNFQIGKGALSLDFSQDHHVGSSPDTLISRDSSNYDDGGHLTIQVTKHGEVTVRHQTDNQSFHFETPKHFFSPGDDVSVTYIWDEDGVDGRFYVVNNTTGHVYDEDIAEPLTIDMGPNFNEPWTIGASQKVSDDNTANHLNEFFDGQIDDVQIYDLGHAADDDDCVDGTDGNDTMGVGFVDADNDTIDGADGDDDVIKGYKGDDNIHAGDGDDTVYGGADSDTIKGGDGDDVVYGGLEPGAGGTTTTRESFEWDKLPDPNGSGGIDDGDKVENVTQDTGKVNVNFKVTSESSNKIDHEFSDSDQLVTGIDDGTETIDDDSGFLSDLSDVHNGSTSYEMTFDKEVNNLDFRVNDADGSANVIIKAYDAAGNQVPVTFSLGGKLQAVAGGFKTADSAQNQYGPENDPNFSALVEIAGPIAKITIHHSEGDHNSGIWFSDVYYDVIETGHPGVDTGDSIDGGLGDDELYGEEGDDRIFGNQGNDEIYGGEGNDNLGGADAGNDTFFGGTGDDMVEASWGDDTLFGGEGNDNLWASADNDTVFGGLGDDSSYGGHGKDIVHGDEGNDTLSGGSDDDSIFGGTGNDVIDGDKLYKDDNGAAGDDYIEGGDGNDTIDAGAGADTVFGGADRDTIIGGNDGDAVDGGTDGDDYDILDLTGAGTFRVVNETVDPDGDSTSGTIEFLDASFNVTGSMTFTEIEEIKGDRVEPDGCVDGTDGNDTMGIGFVDAQGDTIDGADGDDDCIKAGDGNDSVNAGLGDDEVFGGEGNDRLEGGDGNDTISVGNGRDSVFGGDGNDTITGEGTTGRNDINAGDGNDTVIGGESIDVIRGQDGDDVLEGRGGHDEIWGGEGNDTVLGGDSYDWLHGDAGNDYVDGGDGDDRVKGGAGDDTLIGGAGKDMVVGGDDRDTIIGGNDGDVVDGGTGGDDYDILDLTGAGPFRVVNETVDPDGDSTSGTIEFLDADSNVTGSMTFTEIEEIKGDRVEPDGCVDGTDGNDVMGVGFVDLQGDTIDGADGDDDCIKAGDGNDSVDAGQGNDEVFGGNGNDTLNGNNGNDTLYGEDGADRLYGGGGNDSMFGGAERDFLIGGAGEDYAEGGDGNDEVWMGAGNDTAFGGEGNDWMHGQDGNDVLDGGAGNDMLFGEGDDDTLTGGDGNDMLTGGDGADTIFGGKDRDVINGGTFGDVVDGGTEGDDYDILDLTGAGPFSVVNETVDPDGDSTSGTINFLDADGNILGTMEFSEIEEIKGDRVLPDGCVDGTAGNDVMGIGFVDAQGDTIDGADGDDDCIKAGDGNDSVNAGLGNDEVFGGEGNDNIMGNDGDDTLHGDAGNDTMGGGDGDDTLFGGADDDRLFGGEGNDSLFGGAGNDTLSGNRGGDYLDGGEGNDSLNGDIAADTLVGGLGDDLLRGENGDDTIYGGDGSDTADGGDGNDVIDTSGPISLNPNDPTGKPDQDYPGLYVADDDPTNDLDTVYGGGGNDTITTGDDDDSIEGGQGDDVIDAGFDDDTIDGGTGNDTIIGGEGNDEIEGGDGDDTIYGGLEDAFDVLNIKDDEGDLRPDNGDDTIFGGAGNDVIDGKDDSDTIFGGADDDSITGGIDDDVLHGDAGADTFVDDHGADEYFGGADADTFDYTGSSVEYADGDSVDGGTDGIDNDTLDLTGVGRFRKVNETVDADGDSTSGTIEFLDDDDNVIGTMTYTEIENLIPCFTPGTMIATMQGERKVEDLQVGDRVITRDNGAQEVRWIGSKPLSGMQLQSNPHLQPILIQQGALGNGLPERDMLVSPQHRVLVHNADVGLMFNEPEVLVAAKHLIDPSKGIVRVEASQATYMHMMFDHHEVVLSDGAWTESFQPGDQAMAGIGKEQRDEIFQLFPELVGKSAREAYSAARLTLKAHEAEMLKK